MHTLPSFDLICSKTPPPLRDASLRSVLPHLLGRLFGNVASREAKGLFAPNEDGEGGNEKALHGSVPSVIWTKCCKQPNVSLFAYPDVSTGGSAAASEFPSWSLQHHDMLKELFFFLLNHNNDQKHNIPKISYVSRKIYI